MARIAPGPPGASRRPLALPGVPWAILVPGVPGYFFLSSFLVFECVRRSGTFRALLLSGCLKVVVEYWFFQTRLPLAPVCVRLVRVGNPVWANLKQGKTRPGTLRTTCQITLDTLTTSANICTNEFAK